MLRTRLAQAAAVVTFSLSAAFLAPAATAVAAPADEVSAPAAATTNSLGWQ
ncbi:hypothetical protein [Streptomyces sp. NPDC050704]|uniref:hypothetical protein n=1 Tax=Streptomyces sp. NPDC050704 TaxID=3157219 RepID=UPI00341ACDCB